jgi:hypothetical protein
MIPGIDASIKKKDNDNLLDAWRGFCNEGILDLVDEIGLYIRKYSVGGIGDIPLRNLK